MKIEYEFKLHFLHPRGDVLVNEVAQSHDQSQITFTGCAAYGSVPQQAAQEENHDYEVVPLRQLPPLLPARATDLSTSHRISGDYEVVATHEKSAEGISHEVKSDEEHLYDTADAPSTDSTRTAAMHISASQDGNYEYVKCTEIPRDVKVDH